MQRLHAAKEGACSPLCKERCCPAERWTWGEAVQAPLASTAQTASTRRAARSRKKPAPRPICRLALLRAASAPLRFNRTAIKSINMANSDDEVAASDSSCPRSGRRQIDEIWRDLNKAANGNRSERFDKLWSGLRSGEVRSAGAAAAAVQRGGRSGALRAAGAGSSRVASAAAVQKQQPPHDAAPAAAATICAGRPDQSCKAAAGEAASSSPLLAGAAAERCAAQVLDPNAAVRRAALERIKAALDAAGGSDSSRGSGNATTNSGSSSVSELPPAALIKPLLRRFDDASERCRELAARCALGLLRARPPEALAALPYAFPVLEERLRRGAAGPAEPSEEIRLVLVHMLTLLIEQVGCACVCVCLRGRCAHGRCTLLFCMCLLYICMQKKLAALLILHACFTPPNNTARTGRPGRVRVWRRGARDARGGARRLVSRGQPRRVRRGGSARRVARRAPPARREAPRRRNTAARGAPPRARARGRAARAAGGRAPGRARGHLGHGRPQGPQPGPRVGVLRRARPQGQLFRQAGVGRQPAGACFFEGGGCGVVCAGGGGQTVWRATATHDLLCRGNNAIETPLSAPTLPLQLLNSSTLALPAPAPNPPKRRSASSSCASSATGC